MLAFRVPARDAARVRHILSAAPGCSVRVCVPHPADDEVALSIAFEAGRQQPLMDLLMARVPRGQFGRVTPLAGPVH